VKRLRDRFTHRLSPRSTIVVAAAALAMAGITSWRTRAGPDQDRFIVAALALDPSPSTDSLAALAALGRRVYEGKEGGALCVTCHGPQAKGVTGLGPDLTDGSWLHGDGGMAFIRGIIRTGVTRPKKSAAIMPPYGGSPLNPDQLEGIATYIHSLNASR
jgi:mono/diheme cytochrome c family protein